MTASKARLVIGEACRLWASGNVPDLLPLLLDDVVFAVHGSPGAPTVVGEGLSKVLFAHRLAAVLDKIEVVNFDLQGATSDGLWHYGRVRYCYRHRANDLVIEGTMRQKFRFVGDRIAHFELFHDAARMRAFYDMASLA